MIDLKQPTYLGDGVYANFDGWHIVLHRNTFPSNEQIFLDDEVLDNLIKYKERIIEVHSINRFLKNHKVGDFVYYANHKDPKLGRIKRIEKDGRIFVVYHCGDDWANYTNYTAALTAVKHLFEVPKEEIPQL